MIILCCMTVSIIIANHNYEQYLQEAIQSALDQTYQNIEVIVVDDGSNDNSKTIISSFGSKIISIFQSNQGQSASWNAGIARCSGDLICFLDSDDVFLPNKIETLVELYKTLNPNQSFLLYHRLQEINEKSEIFPQLFPPQIRNLAKENVTHHESLQLLSTSEQMIRHIHQTGFSPFLGHSPSGFLINQTLAKMAFPLPVEPSLLHGADHYLTRAASLLGSVYSFNQVLGYYRIHNKSCRSSIKMLPAKFYSSFNAYLNKLSQTNQCHAHYNFFQSTYAVRFHWLHGNPWALFKLIFTLPYRYFTANSFYYAFLALILLPATLWTKLRFGS